MGGLLRWRVVDGWAVREEGGGDGWSVRVEGGRDGWGGCACDGLSTCHD